MAHRTGYRTRAGLLAPCDPGAPATLTALTSAAGYAAGEKAAATSRAYRSDWRAFENSSAAVRESGHI
jgi:hypothetical protein